MDGQQARKEENRMKRMLAMLTAILLLAMPALADDQADINAAYAAVLLEGAPYEAMGDVRPDWQPVRFAVLDLDGDELAEVILEVTEPEAYIILTRYDVVYAAEWPCRGMLSLKDDGTFSFSSGAMDNGVASIILQGDGDNEEYGYLPLAECRKEEDGSVTYWLDGGAEQTDEAGFQAVIDAQNAKLDALWYDYSPENVKMLLGL